MSWINDRYQNIKNALSEKSEIISTPLGKFSPLPESEFQIKAREEAIKTYKESQWPIYALKTLDNIFGENQTNGFYKKIENENKWEVCGVHGSMIFEGKITEEYIHLESHILRTRAYKPSMLRLLLESGVLHDYIRYGISDEYNIVAVVHLEKREAAPADIFEAIKELCINANIYDSLISTEYEEVEWLHQDYVKYQSDEILDLKYDYYQTNLAEIRDFIKMSFENGQKDLLKIAYRLLGFVYKMDYLISPKNYLYGYFMENIDHYWGYMNTQNSVFATGVGILKDAIDEIPEMSKPQFREETVDLPYLFSVRNDWNGKAVLSSVQSNLPNLKKFHSQKEFIDLYWGIQVIIGGMAFHYNIDKYWQGWINALYACTDALYLSKLEYLPPFLKKDSTLPDLNIIKKWLETLIKESQESSNPLPPLPDVLDMEDPLNFVFQVLMVFEN